MPDSATPPHLAVFDLDGTLTKKDTYLSLILYTLNRRPFRWFRTPWLAACVVAYKCRLISNTRLKKEFLGHIFGGLDRKKLRPIVEPFNDRLLRQGMRKAAIDKLRIHQNSGDYCVLLSASFDFYVQDIAERLEFNYCICTVAATDNRNQIHGELQTKNCKGEEKIRRLEEDINLKDFSRISAYGDDTSDIDLLRFVDHGVVVTSNTRLKKLARQYQLTVVNW